MKGLIGLKSAVLTILENPDISPNLLPDSQLNTLANDYFPSPAATILYPSAVHAISLIAPVKIAFSNYFLIGKRGGRFSQMIIFPLSSPEQTKFPLGENLAHVVFSL